MKANTTEYRLLHYWVEKQLGKPKLCVECGTTDEKKRYDWANISGSYLKIVSDWKRMCHRCHMKLDFRKQVCPKGHALKGKNVYVRPKDGHRECWTCKSITNKRRYL